MSKHAHFLIACMFVGALVSACEETAPVAVVDADEEAGGDETDGDETSSDDSGDESPEYAYIYSEGGAGVFAVVGFEDGPRLFELGADASWSRIDLPESLAEKSRAWINNVIEFDGEVLVSTEAFGTWRRDAASGAWERFEPEWVDENNGRVTLVTTHDDRLHAYHEAVDDGGLFMEVWERSDSDWSFVQRDAPMIIDYMPTEQMQVRSTRYGTVEISRDGGDHWEEVRGVVSSVPPHLYEWRDRIVVVTIGAVWIADAAGRDWQQISDVGGGDSTLRGDEVIVADTDGNVAAVALDQIRTRTLPDAPLESSFRVDLAAADDALLISNDVGDLMRLPDGASQWQPAHPLR